MRHIAHRADPGVIPLALLATAQLHHRSCGRENPDLEERLDGERKQVTLLFADLQEAKARLKERL
jgi:hypothetical protein